MNSNSGRTFLVGCSPMRMRLWRVPSSISGNEGYWFMAEYYGVRTGADFSVRVTVLAGMHSAIIRTSIERRS